MRTKEELAWTAGFVDGEGCFTMHKIHGNPYPRLVIEQYYDPEPLDRCKDATGIGYVEKTQGGWRYVVNGFEKVQAFYAMIFPWLSWTKEEQGKKILTEWRYWETYVRVRKIREKGKPEHGTLHMYNKYHCRCPKCSLVKSEHNRKMRDNRERRRQR